MYGLAVYVKEGLPFAHTHIYIYIYIYTCDIYYLYLLFICYLYLLFIYIYDPLYKGFSRTLKPVILRIP